MERLLFSKLFDQEISCPSLALNSIRDVSFNGNCPYTRLKREGCSFQPGYNLLKKGEGIKMKRFSFLGVDVGKESIVVFDGKKRYEFKNERGVKGFRRKFFKKREDRGKTVVIYEPTGPYSAFLEEFCAINKIKVVALNPRKVPRLREVLGHRAKNDILDAELLYEYHKIVSEEEIKVLEYNRDLERLSLLVSEYQLLKNTETKFVNFLEFLERHPVGSEDSKEYMRNNLKELRERILAIERGINELVKRDRDINRGVKEIKKVKGIGNLTAAYCYIFFRKRRIRNRQQVVALAGLDPEVKESGKRRLLSRISKKGDKRLRSLLYMGALSAIGSGRGVLREYYERLISKGKPKKVAIIACARKLLIFSFAHYKKIRTEVQTT